MLLNMRILLGICLMVGGIAMPLSAQSPAVSSDRLGWTQQASASELAELTYAVFVDGTRQPLTGAICAPASAAGSYDCVAPFPAMTPGTHTIELVAIRTMGTTVLESVKSAPLQVQFVIVPVAPANLRVVRL